MVPIEIFPLAVSTFSSSSFKVSLACLQPLWPFRVQPRIEQKLQLRDRIQNLDGRRRALEERNCCLGVLAIGSDLKVSNFLLEVLGKV